MYKKSWNFSTGSFIFFEIADRTVLLISSALGVTVWIALKIHPSMALVWLLAAYVIIGIIESLIALIDVSTSMSAVEPDGRTRLEFVNPRPDSIDVVLKARRR